MSPLKEIPEGIHQYLSEENEEELPHGCLICGKSPFFIGHIEKSNPNRMLIYCLCCECYREPEADITVEKIIFYYETKRGDNPGLTEHRWEGWSSFASITISIWKWKWNRVSAGNTFMQLSFHAHAPLSCYLYTNFYRCIWLLIGGRNLK